VRAVAFLGTQEGQDHPEHLETLESPEPLEDQVPPVVLLLFVRKSKFPHAIHAPLGRLDVLEPLANQAPQGALGLPEDLEAMDLPDHQDLLAHRALQDQLDQRGREEKLGDRLKAHRRYPENPEHRVNKDPQGHLVAKELPDEMDKLGFQDPLALLEQVGLKDLRANLGHLDSLEILVLKENVEFVQNTALWMVESFSRMELGGVDFCFKTA